MDLFKRCVGVEMTKLGLQRLRFMGFVLYHSLWWGCSELSRHNESQRILTPPFLALRETNLVLCVSQRKRCRRWSPGRAGGT